MHLDRFSAKGALYVKVPPWCRKVNMVGGMTMVRPDEFLILKIHLGLAIPFSHCYWLAARPCSFVSALSMACFSSTFVARVRTCTSWLHLVKESIIVRSMLGMFLACPHVCGDMGSVAVVAMITAAAVSPDWKMQFYPSELICSLWLPEVKVSLSPPPSNQWAKDISADFSFLQQRDVNCEWFL